MIPEDSQGTGWSNFPAPCNHLENAGSKCRDGATNTAATEGQIKLFLKGEPEEHMLMPIRRLENN